MSAIVDTTDELLKPEGYEGIAPWKVAAAFGLAGPGFYKPGESLRLDRKSRRGIGGEEEFIGSLHIKWSNSVREPERRIRELNRERRYMAESWILGNPKPSPGY